MTRESRPAKKARSHEGSPSLILTTGNYRELLSYRKAEIVYDLTHQFCRRFLVKFDRTSDQMIQAARSGKQNIVEGCKASGISRETEMKLIGVARASFEELLADYRDFLRVRSLAIWEKESRQAKFVRRLGTKARLTYEDYREFCETRPPEVVANIAICLIHQTNFLLDQQMRRLERDFLKEGGLRERMTCARRQRRSQEHDGTHRTHESRETHESYESHESHDSL
jgi:four helix bundle suffix protein